MAFEKNKKSSKHTPGNQASFNDRIKKHGVLISISAAVLLVAAGIFGVWRFYSNHALPGTSVGGISVSNKSRYEVQKIVEQQRDQLSVTFLQGTTKRVAKASDIGIAVNIGKTTQAAMDAHRRGSFLDRIQVWKTQNVSLAVQHDAGKLKEYVQKQFPEITVEAQDAQIVFDEAYNEFGVKPSKEGKGFDVKQFEASLPGLLRDPQNMTLSVATTPVEPLISTETLLPIKQEVNQRLKLTIDFIYNGQTMYSANPDIIAKWVSFTPDPSTGKVGTTYDKSKIKQFLQDEVSPTITTPPVDRKVLVNASGEEVVIQEGRTGRTLENIDGLVDSIYNAVVGNKAFQQEVSITEAPFKTVTLQGNSDNWVEVDLSKQSTTLYSGDTPLYTFPISSGTASHPTVTGEFRVWYKNASQTMTGGDRASGDYYYLPGVTWVTYFYQDYSFHTAYWHNNFGYPMSHGCINMREGDAKILYDFTPIGTRVVVHY